MDGLFTTLLSVSIATAVSVIGWFVINHQNKKMRKEEVQREIYNKLFDMTVSISNELDRFKVTTDKNVKELNQIFSRLQEKTNEKTALIDKWYNIISRLLDDIMEKCVSIENYLKFLEMGGTNIGNDAPIFQALKSISIDTNKSLFATTEKWINYINFDGMSKIQLDNLVAGATKDLECIDEFIGCLNDILIYIYNSYLAQPLKLKKREIDYIENRRYVTENGLVDKRIY